MSADPLDRLLSGIDRPVRPPPEFAAELLARLLFELERPPAAAPEADERNQEVPMIDTIAISPSSAIPILSQRRSSRAWPPGWPSRDRALAYLATAALVVFTLVASYVAFAPWRPGGHDDPATFILAPNAESATPAADSGPVGLLWVADGGPDFTMNAPIGAALDPKGNLWVVDSGNSRLVVVADENGVLSPGGVTLEAWGAPGSGEGEFNFVCPGGLDAGAVAFDAAGNIYVVDAGNQRIQKFGPDRTFIASWQHDDSGASLFLCPSSIAVGPQGQLYIADYLRSRIEVFSADGKSLGILTEEPDSPGQIAVDTAGNVWVTDNEGVLKFSPTGELLANWDTFGTKDGELFVPTAIAVDAQGRVFVADQDARVQMFSPAGEFLAAWGSLGEEPDEMREASSLVLDGMENIYVVDLFNSRVQKFKLLPPFGPA